jgi:Family of unknown function (DUF5872)
MAVVVYCLFSVVIQKLWIRLYTLADTRVSLKYCLHQVKQIYLNFIKSTVLINTSFLMNTNSTQGMSPQPVDKELYNYVKRLAAKKFVSKSGIYRSSWIVQEYKKRGGRYKGKRPSSKSPGLKRWYKEKWVDLNRPIRNSQGKIVGYKSCGRPSQRSPKYPLCRPSKRISTSTPKTYKEISKKNIQKAKRDKSKVRHRSNIKFGGGQPKRTTSFGCQDGGGPQYRGRRSKVMVKVPANVQKWAAYGFKLKKLGFKGGVETGWKRAKQLATRKEIPIEDLRYMHAWFSRHIITSYPTFKKWNDARRPKTKEWHNRRGIMAWILWAGNAGFNWVNSKRSRILLEKHFDKTFKKIKMTK